MTGSSLYSRAATIHMSTPSRRMISGRTVSNRTSSQRSMSAARSRMGRTEGADCPAAITGKTRAASRAGIVEFRVQRMRTLLFWPRRAARDQCGQHTDRLGDRPFRRTELLNGTASGGRLMAKRVMQWMLVVTAALAAGCGEPYDVVLAGGEVHDGRGGAPQIADVGIRGDRVVTVGDLSGARAETRVDVSGLAVVPGFVDLHSHAVRGVFRHPLAENYLHQGVTTAMGGPDGGSPLPIGEWLEQFEAEGSAINMGLMVGHGTIRREVIGLEARAPTEEELDEMRALVDQAMQDGAYGLSTGLKYPPGTFAETEEVIELAKVAGRYGGIHVSHMREEGLTLMDSVRETIRIGEEGGLPTQLTHHKVVGAPMWGQSTESLRLVDEAVARGVDVTIDQYPLHGVVHGADHPVPRMEPRRRERRPAGAPPGPGNARADPRGDQEQSGGGPGRREPRQRADLPLRMGPLARGQEHGRHPPGAGT